MRLGMVAFGVLCSSLAVAGESGIKSMSPGFRPVVTVLGGYANIEAGNSSRHPGDDSTVFTYTNLGGGQDSWFAGAFSGVEFQIPFHDLFMQAGAEYNYFGGVDVRGLNTVGIEPGTSTLYGYRYQLQSQQVLAVGKLFATAYNIFHPYASVGLGVAFNKSDKFRTATNETGSVNLTAMFNNNSNTAFTYNLGIGVDADITSKLRAGLGYRFSDFGSSSLGNGAVSMNQFVAPVGFKLESSHAYANQLIAQLSYVA